MSDSQVLYSNPNEEGILEIRISTIEGASIEELGDVLAGFSQVLRDVHYEEVRAVLYNPTLSLTPQERSSLLHTAKESINSGLAPLTRMISVREGSLIITAALTSATVFLIAGALQKVNEICGDPIGESVKRTDTYERWVEKLKGIWDTEVLPKRKSTLQRQLEQPRALNMMGTCGWAMADYVSTVTQNGRIAVDLKLKANPPSFIHEAVVTGEIDEALRNSSSRERNESKAKRDEINRDVKH